MRPVSRGDAPADANGTAITFAKYSDARDPLIRRVGDYCSYCEVALHSNVHVEHVQPKSKNAALEKTWKNLLLACDYCNPIKGDKDVALEDYYWPDTDNTARPLIYELDRAPQCAGWLSDEQHELAQDTLLLTGLDREPGHSQLSDRDRRWLKRREAWGVALHERRKIAESNTPQQRDSAVQVAIARGFWSVWMQVFHDDQDMRGRLILGFQGTAQCCFDANTQPIARPGGRI